MRISIVYFLSFLAGRSIGVDGTYRNLRRVKDLDEDDEKLLIEEIFDGDAEGVGGQRILACDDKCRAKRRLVRCKRKAREEAREGRKAWTKEDQDEAREGRRLRLYCESAIA